MNRVHPARRACPAAFLVALVASLFLTAGNPPPLAVVAQPAAAVAAKKAAARPLTPKADPGAQLEITGSKVRTVTVVDALPFTISAPKGALLYFWKLPAGVAATEHENDSSLEVTAAPPGELAISCKLVMVDFDQKKAQTVALDIAVNVGAITPPVPVPPGPGPVPPGPTPTPDPAPIPAAGLSVLIVEESAARSTLPREQLLTLTATGPGSVRDYLNTHCAKAANGWPEWRILDKDTDMSGESQFWKDAMRLPRDDAKLPWLMVTNGKGGYSGSLPATQAETMAILKKYGG